jgi:ribonuclease Y
MTPGTIGLIAALAGVAGGYIVRQILFNRSNEDLESKQKELLLDAKEEALKVREEAKKEDSERKRELQKTEERLREREISLERRMEKIETDRAELERRLNEVEEEKKTVETMRGERAKELEKVAQLTSEQARDQLLGQVEKDYSEDITRKIRSMKETMKKHWDVEAREIIATTLERLATEQTAEATIASVHLPSEEIKGKIIGKEGRNIQAFEKATGVDLVIDETPETVLISSFDPVRRAVAAKAMQMLIKDGRIQPTKIEELVEKAQKIIEEEMKDAGETAVHEVGLTGIHPELVRLLGSLKYRTSYGQNQLQHAIEVSHIAGVLAAEVGADINITKKAALLHDIGKAVSHEYPGSHVDAGADLARKYGMSEAVVQSIEASHEDVDAKSVEAILSRTADAISSARPGARRESTDQYIKRMKELENVAATFPGVHKAFAIQAGREIRVLVKPEMIDDLTAMKLARDVANKIEADLQYPGTVKVNIIRETRFTEVAR